ncbi:cyclin-domain-containing protein [Mycena floridula]|nr:cyclin-domain-containing protein [Mycena floridula]
METTSSRVLPATFEQATIDQLVVLIADMLDRLKSHNDRIPLLPENLTRFHSRSAPNISILDYLKRIVKFTNVEKSCLLLTLFYVDQICARMPLFILSSLTSHRFIITSVAISSKGLCDSFSTNSLYAKVGGIPVAELNVLEREFLSMIDWRLMCTRDILQEYYVNLVRTHSSGQFTIAGTDSASSSSSDSDIEMDSGQSRPPTPPPIAETSAPRRQRPRLVDVTITPPSVARRPTFEQNMAFAELQQSQDSGL